MKTWYSIKAAAAGGDTAEISVYDYIGYYGVSAVDFLKDVKAIDAPNIKVSINSPGGDVFDAIAMVNGLRLSGKKITTVVMGIAASAASYLMLAGDHRVMPDNAMQMVHNASTGRYGNAAELQEVVDTLRKMDDNLHATYMTRTGLSKEKVVELLSKDTFLTAAECKELGLVDEVIPAVKMTAAYDVDRLPTNVQALFKAVTQPNPPATPLAEYVQTAAKAAGLEKFTAVFVTDPAVTSTAEADAVIARAREVSALCTAAALPDEIDAMLRERKTLIEVRAALSAKLVEIDAATRVDTARKTKTIQSSNDNAWSPNALWTDIKAMKAGSK